MFRRNTPAKSGRAEDGSTHILATWGIAGFIAAACALLIGLEISYIVSQRSAVLEDGRKDTANLSSSLILQAEQTFRSADTILIGIVERLEHESLDARARERLTAWFVRELRHSPQYLSFSVIDSDGALVASSVGEREPGLVSDREYFVYHRTHDDDAVRIGSPIRGRRSDGWLIPVTRRFNRPDGTFGGVAVAAIKPKYFQELYDRLELGNNSAVVLISPSGTLLVRRPFIEANVGRDMSQSGVFAQLKQAPKGSVELPSSTDGVMRLNSFERGQNYPIVIAVAQDMDDLLAPWKRAAMRRLAETAIITVFILLMGAFVWRATRTLSANSIKLRETNALFDAALANMSNGLSMFDADGRLMVWNEKYLELYGMSPDIVRSGVSIRSIVEHRKQLGNLDLDVDAYVGEFRRTLIDAGRSTSTSQLRDGRIVSVINTAIAGGGWVAVHEDVTTQRLQEKLVAEKAAELELINARFNAALRNMSQGLCLFDPEQQVVIANARYAEIYRLAEDQVKPGTTLKQILDFRRENGTHFATDPDAYVSVNVKLASEIHELADGRVVSIKRQPMANGGWLTTHEDVTAEKRGEKLLADKAAELEVINTRFAAALSNMSQAISMYDRDRRLVVWNQRYAEIYRLPQKLLQAGTHVNAITADLVARGVLKGDTDRAAIDNKIVAMDQMPIDSSRVEEFSDGRLMLISRQPMADGGWVATHEDITERRRAEAEIVHLARHDALTGLANRAEFNAKLEEASKRLKRGGGAVTVMMLDLDKFKAVNDTLGHPAGDQLLVEVGRRLQSTLRETDVLARLGGDEFAIIQEGGTSQHEGAIALALRIISAISQPFDLDGQIAGVGTSIGIALAPEHGVEPEQLMKSADLALYHAKANGRNDFSIYHTTMLEVAHTQQSAEGELRDAIAREEFELHYQPVMDLNTRLLCGVEALVRWRHPTKGLIPPDRFIPLAESTGLIVPLGDWVLQQACADAASWPAHLKIAVNISAVQFNKGNLFDVILCTLVETGLAPERLELEITETSLLESQEAHLATIRQLKNLGISLALDDFGTGYSSMTYLTNFPFDKIKIDKSFTQGALNRRECAAVVSSVLALAQGLGTITTAEGIETEEQLAYMREAGVDLAQGYLIGRPVPISQLDLNNTPLARTRVA
jgi:diguanylate cyclase (GGDEF)-like protein